TGWRLHPGVECENPEGGQAGANSNQQGSEGMHARGYAIYTEQHDAQKSRLKKKCRQHFVARQGAGNIANGLHVARPVGAELERHHQTTTNPTNITPRKCYNPETLSAHPDFVVTAIVLLPQKQQNPA